MGTSKFRTLQSERIRVGQVGVGYWEPNRLRTLCSHDRVEVRRVTDPSPKHRAYVQQLFPNVKVSSDPAEIFNDREIDAVVIATHHANHAELALEALKAGKHILVEKPLATTMEDMDRIATEARSRNLVAMVGHTYVYSPAVRALRQLINTGELGQVRYIYAQRLNLGRIRQDLDALWHFAPHDISIIQYIFGDPVPFSVNRFGMDYIQRGTDDVAFLTVTYPNKVVAQVHVSWLDPQSVRRMVIVGSEKMAVYDDAVEKKVVIYDRGIDRMALMPSDGETDSPPAWTFGHRTGGGIALEIGNDDPLREEISHFHDCIANGVECFTGVEHASRVLKILLAGTKKESMVKVEGEMPKARGANGVQTAPVQQPQALPQQPAPAPHATPPPAQAAAPNSKKEKEHRGEGKDGSIPAKVPNGVAHDDEPAPRPGSTN